MTRILIPIAFVMFASAASATGSAIVFTAGDPPTARISAHDVDVLSPIGRMTVERRIQTAARQVCLDTDDSGVLAQSRHHFADCYQLALSGGVSQLEQLAGE